MHQPQAYRSRIELLRLCPEVVLVICMTCQGIVSGCPTRDDAIWAAAAHTVQGVG